jgi:hypothetical protein
VVEARANAVVLRDCLKGVVQGIEHTVGGRFASFAEIISDFLQIENGAVG